MENFEALRFRKRPPLAQEEIELLATSDEALRKSVEIFCFDLEQCQRRILSGEKWQQLLQAHLYFEHVISVMLHEALLHPEAIKLKTLGFTSKVDLLSAMGLLDQRDISTIKVINNLRNKIAHDLNFELTDKHLHDLQNSVKKAVQQILLANVGREPGPLRFGELLYATLLTVEIARQNQKYLKLAMKKSQARLLMALDKSPGIKYVP